METLHAGAVYTNGFQVSNNNRTALLSNSSATVLTANR